VSAIYNEIEPYAAQWIRNLIAAGHIADGVVDERSIADLRAADVAGPGQRHFFAGLGAWSHALRLAGVPDTADVWTGSCPCQGLSDAGKRLGFADPRHLWPVWFELIRECRPAVVFGEQVASALGLEWLDLVFADLEGAGYACAAADLPAASVGAPHKRSRLFFVAYADGESGRLLAAQRQPRRANVKAVGRGEASPLADADSARSQGRIIGRIGPNQRTAGADRVALDMGHADGLEFRGHTGAGDGSQGTRRHQPDPNDAHASGATRGFWANAEWLACRDGVARAVEPGTFPLAHGATARVGRLRAYGNAIVSEVAAEFIAAALEAA